MTEKIVLFCFAAFLLLGSCQTQRPLMVPEADVGDDGVMAGWMSLSDGTFHSNQENLTPAGYYVKGQRKAWDTFHPTSAICGKGPGIPEEARSRAAWIELDDGSIRRVEEGLVPRPPYVRGYVDENGKFYPEPKEIVR